MVFYNKYENIEAVVIELVRNLKINIDSVEISAELEKQPDYPDLLAISDVLTNFNIDNISGSRFKIYALLAQKKLS
jgi:hypothetical protein